MTFSIAARCPRTGQYGVAVSSYSPMSGAFVPVVISDRCAVAYQNTIAPMHRVMAGQLLSAGASAAGALAELAAKDPHWPSRQVTLVDMHGGVAGHTGERAAKNCSHRLGAGFAVAGNVMTESCVDDTFSEFSSTQDSDLPLAARLMRALEAGARSNGQPQGLTSAALLVHAREPWPLLDLRVDVSDAPIKELRRAFDFVEPLLDYYRRVRITPEGRIPWYQERMDKMPGWKPNHLIQVVPQQ
jgi:uncharacterized Ntn-hydrolase superfamily protein